MQAAIPNGTVRAHHSCANLAHGFAASGPDKPVLRNIKNQKDSGPVLLHVVIGMLLFVLGIAIANVIGTWLGRDVAHTSDAAIPWLWLMLLGAELGWMAFVYARRTFRVRLLLFGAIAEGALLAGCIANYVYSPPLPGR